MTEADWWTAQVAEPTNLLLMAHFADWLQERDDPRWEPMQLLFVWRRTGIVSYGALPIYTPMGVNPGRRCDLPRAWTGEYCWRRDAVLERFLTLTRKCRKRLLKQPDAGT